MKHPHYTLLYTHEMDIEIEITNITSIYIYVHEKIFLHQSFTQIVTLVLVITETYLSLVPDFLIYLPSLDYTSIKQSSLSHRFYV